MPQNSSHLHIQEKKGRIGVTSWLASCVVGLVLMWLFAGWVSSASARPLAQSAADGEALFKQKCAACHTIGGGKLVGPDLQGVSQRRDVQWVKGFITSPDQYLASDPTAKALLAEYMVSMPNLGLAPAEVDAILAYLQVQSAPQGGTITAQPATSVQPAQPLGMAGDPILGARLFRGEQRLTNGGTPCLSCHTVAGLGALGGGKLGPDLTHVIQRYGGSTGLGSTLAALPFPTMQGSFATRPLTPVEQADLLAYFVQEDQQVPRPAPLPGFIFWGTGAAGTLLLFGIMAVFWPRQRQSLSETLRKKRS